VAILKDKKIVENYSVFRNSLLQNSILSYEAKGLLLELLSHSEDWVIRKSQLERPHCGKEKLQRIFNELKSAGFLTIETKNNKNGKIEDRIWSAADNPQKLKK